MECFRPLLGDGGLGRAESDCNTWNIGGENTPENPEVMILANVIMGPRRDLRLYALSALRNRPNRHGKTFKADHIMAMCFNTYKGYPKNPMTDSFK